MFSECVFACTMRYLNQCCIASMVELKVAPCPFCGGVELFLLEVDLSQWAIECRECGSIGPDSNGSDQAAHAWNKRPSPALAWPSVPGEAQ